MLEGRLPSLGTSTCSACAPRDCRTGDTRRGAGAGGEERRCPQALEPDRQQFRTRVGESLATVEKHDTPLEEATTPSLEALKAYSEARKIRSRASDPPPAPLFKRAIEIDPKFAMAHASLGIIYGLMGQLALSAESNRKPMSCGIAPAIASEFFITASYECW